ncbi:hypothetical protein EDM56_20175 [Brevibacillus fluminis]|uniref:Lipoprotein n=1 Tax=Brevibacillus fluminis TaxID=511487 RepID=A0A3M8D906_9BACL|nr:hypothetical protein [Brevibacillus fluminis]RNB84438.1 hypothetical protein EDM56_20175 [Brevibacillus fluminis]
MNMRSAWCVMLVAAWLLTACTNHDTEQPSTPASGATPGIPATSTTAKETSVPAKGIIRAEPEQLFTGEEKKYQPFVGSMSGGVKFTYSGNKNTIGVDVELWENGKKQQTLVSTESPLDRPSEKSKGMYNGEFIAAVSGIKTEGDQQRYDIKFTLTDEQGTVTNEFSAEKHPSFQLSSLMALQGPAQAGEDTGLAVWGFQATDEHSLSSTGSILEDVRKAKYAIVFRIVVKD